MAGRGHRDIYASNIAWGQGSSDGIRYARFLIDEADASSPPIVFQQATGAMMVPKGLGA